MSTLKECIERYEADLATRPADRPFNVIRVAMLQTTAWRADVKYTRAKFVTFGTGRAVLLGGGEADRCSTLAETGEHLGIERVGLVVESREDRP